jgi:FkbM family methyltransferase
MSKTQAAARRGFVSITAPRIITVMAVSVALLVTLNAGQIGRRVRFKATGLVQADGFTLRLDPKDEIITQAILRDGSWEKSETAVIRRLLQPGDTFVDVGANMGWYTLVASKAVGSTGRVISFEPAPSSYSLLQRNVKDNGCRNTTLEAKALSDKRGTLRLHLGETNKGHNSIIKSSATRGFVDVEALTLDEYLGSVPGVISLVKIDTEGAEGFILDGMAETFKRNPGMALVMEYHPSLMRLAGFDPEKVLGKFYGRGYTVEAIEPETGRTKQIKVDNIKPLTSALEKYNAFVNILLKPSH